MQEKENKEKLQEDLQDMLKKSKMERKLSLSDSYSAKGMKSVHIEDH